MTTNNPDIPEIERRAQTTSDPTCVGLTFLPTPDFEWLLSRVRELEGEVADADILMGAEWRASVRAVNGDPEAARQHRIAALVADLDEAAAKIRELESRVAEAAAKERERCVEYVRLAGQLDSHIHARTICENVATCLENMPYDT